MIFPGYEASMLAFEANGVVGLRLIKIARGGPCREPSWLENIELHAKKAMKRENIDQEYSHV